MVKKTISIAVIGPDSNDTADRQAAAYRRLPGASLAGVWPTAEALAGTGADTAVSAAPRFDLIDLCLPPEAIPAAVPQLHGLTRVLLLPAPMCRTRADADHLLRLLKRQKQTALLKAWADFAPAAARLREIVSSGCLGPVLRISLQRPAAHSRQDGPADAGTPNWMDWYDDLELVLCLTGVPAAKLELRSPVSGAIGLCDFTLDAAGAGSVVVELSRASDRAIQVETALGRLSLTWAGPGGEPVLCRKSAGGEQQFNLPVAVPGELAAAWAVRCLRLGEDFNCGQPGRGRTILAWLEQLGATAPAP